MISFQWLWTWNRSVRKVWWVRHLFKKGWSSILKILILLYSTCIDIRPHSAQINQRIMTGTTVCMHTSLSIFEGPQTNTTTHQKNARVMIKNRELAASIPVHTLILLSRDYIIHINIRLIHANSSTVRRRAVRKESSVHSFILTQSKGQSLTVKKCFCLSDWDLTNFFKSGNTTSTSLCLFLRSLSMKENIFWGWNRLITV